MKIFRLFSDALGALVSGISILALSLLCYLVYQMPVVRSRAEPLLRPAVEKAAPVVAPLKQYLFPRESLGRGITRRVTAMPVQFARDARRILEALLHRTLDMVFSWQTLVILCLCFYFRRNLYAAWKGGGGQVAAAAAIRSDGQPA